jgi:hypothetical protein
MAKINSGVVAYRRRNNLSMANLAYESGINGNGQLAAGVIS